MKITAFILPAAAILIAGASLGFQSRSIATMRSQNTLLQNQLAADTREIPLLMAKSSLPKPSFGNGKINWKEVAAKLTELRHRNERDFGQAWRDLQLRMSSMSPEELSNSLDEILSLDLPMESRNRLEQIVIDPIMLNNPELVLSRFGDRMKDDQSWIFWKLSDALAEWARKDPTKATAWLDLQIAEGKLDSKSVDGVSNTRLKFEAGLIRVLPASSHDAAKARLAVFPMEQQISILDDVAYHPMTGAQQEAFVDFIRGNLPENQQARSLAEHVLALSGGDFKSSLYEYIDRIKATPTERRTILERASHCATDNEVRESILEELK